MSADAPDPPSATGRTAPRPLYLVAGGLCVLLGSVGAVSVPALLPLWTVFGGLVGGVVYLAARDPATDGPPPPDHRIGRGAARAGAATTAVCLALTGVGSLLGPAGGPVIVLLLLALALWAWRARPHLPGRTVADAGALPQQLLEPRPDPGELTALDLCRAWQRSYLALIDVPDGPVRDEIATWRRNLLDELERRDPVGFQNWLHTGARAGSDPAGYLDLTSDQ